MTRATKAKKARQQATPPTREPRLPRGLLFLAVAVAAGVVAAGALLWSSSGQDGEKVFAGVPFTDPGPIHVHGLGINQADGSLFIATHTGLFRVGKDSRKAVRIADRHQDTMGFSIVGPNRFLGSGHPDAREQKLPPLLGLIESTDAGKTWRPISLLGEADFHVLRSVGKHVYGYDASNDRLLASTDEGQIWKELDKPAPIVDLAPNPDDPQRLVVTAIGGLDQGMFASRNGGQSWQRLNEAVGYLAWPAPERLYLIDETGQALISSDGGHRLAKRGSIGGRPAALLASGKDELYVALHDGTIKRSTDGGATWTARSSP
ncbi:MAG: exo-alpha-sialidase [Actinobacteria bacterium]|nr:exo-alpha-sialidase [Actinomycetota bacterium]